MSEQTNEANPQSEQASKLYDSQGQVIRHGQPGHQPRGAGEEVMRFIHEQPLAAVAIAFGVGYFVGKII